MTHRRKRVAVLLCFALLADPPGLGAQEGSESFVEVLDVRVTSVDVVVTGPEGRPVTGLTAADFEIYEDGKRQEVTNFYEVGDARSTIGTIAIEAREPIEIVKPRNSRKFIFYFDNGSLSVHNRNQIFPAVRDFLGRSMGTGDRAMIVTWNRELNVRLPWTGDLKMVDATLATMAKELGSASQLQADRRRAEHLLEQAEIDAENPKALSTFQMVEVGARAYAESVRHDISQSVGAMTRLLASLSGVDGRKVLVVATESLPTTAGAEIFERVESLRDKVRVSSTSQLRDGARSGSRISDMARFNVAPMIEQLATAANATGVTIYALNPRGLVRDDAGKTEQTRPGDASVDFADSMHALDGVGLLARKTGGVSMVGAPASVALAGIERDLGSYYSLGYRAKAGASPNRNIDVRIKRPGHSLRSRASVHYRSIETEMADRVLANQLESELSNELGVSLQSDPVTTEGSRQVVPLRIIIPIDKLTLLPAANGGVNGGFSVFLCSGNGSGDNSGVNLQSHRINWSEAEAAQMKGRKFGYAVSVPIARNRHQISVGVVDHISQVQGFAVIKLGDPAS